MTLKYVRDAVVENWNDIYFRYNGINCGVEIHGTLETFDLLYGDEMKTVDGGFEAAVREPFFNGYSILELFDTISDTIHFV